MKSFLKELVIFLITLEARAVLWKYEPKIIAVTGSVGKTSSKDAIYVMISASVYARSSPKSYNSEIGVPLTILGVDNPWSEVRGWLGVLLEGLLLLVFRSHYPDWLVVETGVDRPGDMKALTSWLKPDIAVVTRFPDTPVHVEFFKSPKEVIEEKKGLARAVKKDGVLVLNADDENVYRLKEELSHLKTVTYGFSNKSAVRASNLETIYENKRPTGLSFRLESGGNSIPVKLEGVLSKVHVYPIISGAAVCTSPNINLVKGAGGLKDYKPQPGRMKILKGIESSTIIDDSYNSSPIALMEALTGLSEVKTEGRKIVALGDMTELGKYAEEAHEKAGETAAEFADFILTYGKMTEHLRRAALKKGFSEEKVLHFESHADMSDFLKKELQKGDVVLLKGSQSQRMEKVVFEIMAEKEKASKLLVRQEKEWEKR